MVRPGLIQTGALESPTTKGARRLKCIYTGQGQDSGIMWLYQAPFLDLSVQKPHQQQPQQHQQPPHQLKPPQLQKYASWDGVTTVVLQSAIRCSELLSIGPLHVLNVKSLMLTSECIILFLKRCPTLVCLHICFYIKPKKSQLGGFRNEQLRQKEHRGGR